MRYIDSSFVALPEGWEEKAEEAQERLCNKERTAEQQRHIWSELKGILGDLSHTCCWYCETSIPRTDNAVDHYRPKGTVRGVVLSDDGKKLSHIDLEEEHKGYDWCTFSLDNFRFSCQHCNEYRKDIEGSSGGKWNYFPLINEPERAYSEAEQDYEIPAILDPCNVLDWRLLSYNIDGKPFSRFEPGSEEDRKVRYSIRILHLDNRGLNEGRRAQWALVKPLVKDAKKWYLRTVSQEAGAHSCFQQALKRIRQHLNPSNPAAYIGFLVYKLENDREIKVHPWMKQLAGAI